MLIDAMYAFFTNTYNYILILLAIVIIFGLRQLSMLMDSIDMTDKARKEKNRGRQQKTCITMGYPIRPKSQATDFIPGDILPCPAQPRKKYVFKEMQKKNVVSRYLRFKRKPSSKKLFKTYLTQMVIGNDIFYNAFLYAEIKNARKEEKKIWVDRTDEFREKYLRTFPLECQVTTDEKSVEKSEKSVNPRDICHEEKKHLVRFYRRSLLIEPPQNTISCEQDVIIGVCHAHISLDRTITFLAFKGQMPIVLVPRGLLEKNLEKEMQKKKCTLNLRFHNKPCSYRKVYDISFYAFLYANIKRAQKKESEIWLDKTNDLIKEHYFQ